MSTNKSIDIFKNSRSFIWLNMYTTQKFYEKAVLIDFKLVIFLSFACLEIMLH